MGSVASVPPPVGDQLPESDLIAATLRTAAGLSIAAFFVLAYIVCTRRLLRTALMKQVLSLCMCDCLTCLWEMLSCPSMVHVPGFCISTPCSVFMPMLRTFQMSSMILSSQIAVSVACVVHGRKVPLAGAVSWVVPTALLLCLPSWLVTFSDDWVSAFDQSKTYCSVDGSWRSPDQFWAAEIIALLTLVLVLYVTTMCRIWRLASPTVVARKLQRVLSYLVVFLFCYAPYVLWQGFGSTTMLYEAMATSRFYQACYFLYLLTGVCNVASYGLHNWDDSCWRRGDTSTRLSAGREIRVIMFASKREEINRSAQSSLHSGADANLVSDEVSPQEPQEGGGDPEQQQQGGGAESAAAQLAGASDVVLAAMEAAVEYGAV